MMTSFGGGSWEAGRERGGIRNSSYSVHLFPNYKNQSKLLSRCTNQLDQCNTKCEDSNGLRDDKVVDSLFLTAQGVKLILIDAVFDYKSSTYKSNRINLPICIFVRTFNSILKKPFNEHSLDF